MDKIIHKLILLRHEQRPTNPGFETNLTEVGKNNSGSIPDTLIRQGKLPEIIYSSPFLRCLQTVQPLMDHLSDVKIRTENCLSEWFQPEDNRTDIARLRQLTEKEQQEYSVDKNYQSVIKVTDLPDNEVMYDLTHRVNLFIDYLVTTYGDNQSVKNILVVTHQSVIESILERFNKRPNCNDKTLKIE